MTTPTYMTWRFPCGHTTKVNLYERVVFTYLRESCMRCHLESKGADAFFGNTADIEVEVIPVMAAPRDWCEDCAVEAHEW